MSEKKAKPGAAEEACPACAAGIPLVAQPAWHVWIPGKEPDLMIETIHASTAGEAVKGYVDRRRDSFPPGTKEIRLKVCKALSEEIAIVHVELPDIEEKGAEHGTNHV